jgi:hypothetical protein
MTLIEELKKQFPIQKFSLHGECVVVPGTEFDPDWEDILFEQGYNSIDTDLDGKAVTLVRLTRKEKSGVKVVCEPKPLPSPKSTPLGRIAWTKEEYQKLVELWNARKKVREIASNFPDRTGHAVVMALARLKNSGSIKPRWTQNRRDKRASTAGTGSGPGPIAPAPGALPSTPLLNVTATIVLNFDLNKPGSLESLRRFLREAYA